MPDTAYPPIAFTRLQNGDVAVVCRGGKTVMTHNEWINAVADVSEGGKNDARLVTAAMVHDGRSEVRVHLAEREIAEIVLGHAASQLVAPATVLPLNRAARRNGLEQRISEVIPHG